MHAIERLTQRVISRVIGDIVVENGTLEHAPGGA
jgi:hypothetical protein